MIRKFNITGMCVPSLHYMVNISNKVKRIIELVEQGCYFVINRPRQYGKTTTLFALENELKKNDEYLVISISLEGLGEERFANAGVFIAALSSQCELPPPTLR